MIDKLPQRHKSPRKITLANETRSAIRSLLITLSAMIVVLMIVFLVTTNQGAQKGYSLEQAKLKNEELLTENSNISSKILNVTSIAQLEENSKLDQMSASESKLYVTEEDNRVR